MAEIVLFHHVLGLTDGVRAFAERLAGAEHTVHTPDLYGGEVAGSLEAGFELKNRIGDDTLAERTDAGSPTSLTPSSTPGCRSAS